MDEIVEYENIVKSNFLTKPRYRGALAYSFGFLALCLIFSNFYWSSTVNYLSANGLNVFDEKEYWRLITSCFVHGDLGHLFSNSMMLGLMSYYVHAFYGFKIFPFLSILMGALVNYFVLLNFDNPKMGIVGASGIVYYLWGFWLILYLFIQRHVGVNRRLMKITAISLIILLPSQLDPQVSYLAHFLGFIFGLITGLMYFIIKKNQIFAQEDIVRIQKIIPNYENEWESTY